ncbi:MAG TPA: bifunctional glutamate N-acetyltransferase/amino-acid acetyltransferase ArgJ [Vicinamibacteria bacterium]|nr:bifunctional glutamate N-acetyltransferase/amino-acid acetyltransferase ArgJ [Vicinamibacteria bacterium]
MTTGVTAPLGFRAAAAASGIRPDSLDLALLVADGDCAAAGVFTTNLAQAAPVLLSREHVAGGRARAIVVNAGCANAGTGDAGLADARETAGLVADAVGCGPREVLVASTGVIGVRLPMEKLRAGIPEAGRRLSREGGADAARAILTTDTRPKEVAVEFPNGDATCVVGGMAKGAGMVAPSLATMLAFFTTDAGVEASLLRRALVEAVGDSLNRITVDGDTSTNDCALVLASGARPAPPIAGEGLAFDAFRRALAEAARRLAELLVRDGEGVTRVAEVRVEGARTAADADRVARTVAESPLVKTALHGGDPNWGRVLAAVGRSGVPLEVSRVSIWIGDVHVADKGSALPYDETTAAAAMREEPVRLRVRLGEGEASGWMLTSDFSHGYVDINAHYRS